MGREQQERKLVIGKWGCNDAMGVPEFCTLEQQPSEPITDIGKMVQWAKETLKDKPGTYDFVRAIPGQLVIGVQTVLSFSFNSKNIDKLPDLDTESGSSVKE